LTKLSCSNYGFECDFVTEGEVEQVIEEFRDHTESEHGIDYSKEALMQFILRKTT
jgi:predicted small metal-binding protein